MEIAGIIKQSDEDKSDEDKYKLSYYHINHDN